MKLNRGTLAMILNLAWNAFNRQIAKMDAESLLQLLEAELNRPHRERRAHVVRRLTQRYCAQHNAEVRERIRQRSGV